MSDASRPVGGSLPGEAAEAAARPVEGRPRLDPTIQTILDEAQARLQKDVEAQHAYQQSQARLQRALEAWNRVASYRGDAIPRGLTSTQICRGYAEGIVALGRVLATDGWHGRLDAVTPETKAKTYALAILRRAMDGDLAAVEEMVQGAQNTLWQLGLAADNWLREGLMYEVLGIQPQPEAPLGWEGSYLQPVETVADLVAWIDHELQLHDILGKGQGEQLSDGRSVRNAFRLVSHLGLTGLPPEPLGSRKLHDELAVLRNLRRLCLPLLERASAEGGVAGEAIPVRVAEADTAEELVQQCLSDQPLASMEDIRKATGLSEWTVLRTQTWKEHAERQLEAYLRQHPQANALDVQRALGSSPSKVVTMRAWKDHRERKNADRSRRQVQSRERPLTDAIVNSRADESAVDPATAVSQRDQIFQTVLDQVDVQRRGVLNGLRIDERNALMDRLLLSMDDEGAKSREPDATIAILVEVTQSWLEEWQEERQRVPRERRSRKAP
jgi:hypothetical protein